MEREGNLMEEIHFPENKNVFKISEAADLLGVKPYVLRYWETEFQEARTRKSYSGQRVYHKEDIQRIQFIRDLLYKSKYSIAGARAVLKEHRDDVKEEPKPQPTKAEMKKSSNHSEDSKSRKESVKALESVMSALKELSEKISNFELSTD